MRATITIFLKSGVLDPQGQAQQKMLQQLGFDNINDVRQGKILNIDLNESNHDKALATLHDMCRQLLVNDVMESYDITLDDK